MDADEYQRMFDHELDHFRYVGLHALLEQALRRFAPEGPRRILDAGCGTGGLLTRLVHAGTCVGIDASELALGGARRRGHTRLARASVQSLPFAAARFDVVISVDVLYHRAVGDDAAALREFARVCRPGGCIVLVLPAHEWLRGGHDEVVHTARRYSRRMLRELAGKADLKVERLGGFYAALLLPALVHRWRSRRQPARSDVLEVPRGLNRLLIAWLRCEAWVLLRWGLPPGLSQFAVLRRREA